MSTVKTSSVHTSGPWHVSPVKHQVWNKACNVIADLQESELSFPNLETLANAQLIASAPELLEALEDVFEDWVTLVGEDLEEQNEDVKRIWKKAESAISKAKGE